jgi:hypothetical protein
MCDRLYVLLVCLNVVRYASQALLACEATFLQRSTLVCNSCNRTSKQISRSLDSSLHNVHDSGWRFCPSGKHHITVTIYSIRPARRGIVKTRTGCLYAPCQGP